MATPKIFIYLQITDPSQIDGTYGFTTLKSTLRTDGFYYLNSSVLQSEDVPFDLKTTLAALQKVPMTSAQFNEGIPSS